MPNYNAPWPSLIQQALPTGQGKWTHPGSISLPLSTGYNFLGVGDIFISPQQLRNAMDTTGTETQDQSTERTWCSIQIRSEPRNSGSQHMWSAEKLPPETSLGMKQENSTVSLFRSVLARNLNPRDPITASAWARVATTAAQMHLPTSKDRMTDLCNTPGEVRRAQLSLDSPIFFKYIKGKLNNRNWTKWAEN